MRALRPRIEHAQILASADVPRFAALGVIASMQPTHCTSDMPWAPARLGAVRVAEEAYVWQKLLKSGARFAAGSDFPVERPDPLPGFYAAITRQDRTGQPPEGWAPDQRLTRDEALAAFTIGAAYAAHAERDLGSLEAGKLADFVVLSRDIMTVPPAEILTTTVLETVVGGVTVYAAPNFRLGPIR
jgi:predicted amidohydrolase YtcJ